MNSGLSDRLRSARLARGWTQAELARRCDLDRAHVARLESGQRGASMETLARLVEVLQLDPREVFAELPPASAPPPASPATSEAPLLAAEPAEPAWGAPGAPDASVARLMALRGYATAEEAVRAAVSEAVDRAVAERKALWRGLLGAALGEGASPHPRFASDDDLWKDT